MQIGQSDDLTARWKAEKAKVGQGAQLRETLDRLRAELAAAQRAGDLGRASEIAYGQIPRIEKQLAEAEAAEPDKSGPLTPEVSTPNRSPPSSAAGPASPSTRCWRASAKSCSRWRTPCAAASSVRTRRWRPCPTPSAAPAPA